MYFKKGEVRSFPTKKTEDGKAKIGNIQKNDER